MAEILLLSCCNGTQTPQQRKYNSCAIISRTPLESQHNGDDGAESLGVARRPSYPSFLPILCTAIAGSAAFARSSFGPNNYPNKIDRRGRRKEGRIGHGRPTHPTQYSVHSVHHCHQSTNRSGGFFDFSVRSRHVDWLYPFWKQNFWGKEIST